MVAASGRIGRLSCQGCSGGKHPSRPGQVVQSRWLLDFGLIKRSCRPWRHPRRCFESFVVVVFDGTSLAPQGVMGDYVMSGDERSRSAL